MRVPPVLAGLVDDAALVPPCTTDLVSALSAHRGYRAAWYADLVGPWLLPASRCAEAAAVLDRAADRATDRAEPDAGCQRSIRVGVVGDAGPAPSGLREVASAIADRRGQLEIEHVETPVAMRGDDPLPGLRAVLDLERAANEGRAPLAFYPEIPLTWGVLASLDVLGEASAAGARVAPKFRVGGLAAELFPTPVELGAIICACRDRDLPFKLTAGTQRAVRRTDPETGLVNHGFLNVLAAVLAAHTGMEAAELAELLGSTDPSPLVALVTRNLEVQRPLWRGFSGCCGMEELLGDLRVLELLPVPPETSP